MPVKRGCRFILIVAIVGFLVLVVAVLSLDRKYEFLFASSRVPHDRVVSPNLGLRVSIQPEHASDYLVQLLRQQRDVPDWAFARLLPYEVAFVLEPQGAAIDSTFYINAQRFGPQLAAYVREANLASRITFVRWTAPELDAQARGMLVMKGTLPTDREAQRIANAAWPISPPATPLPLEGGHFVEVVADNRAGSAYVTALSLLVAQGVPEQDLDRESYKELTHFIQEVRLTADVASGTELDITLRLVCDPATYQERVGTIDFVFPSLVARVQQLLAERYGAELDGSTGWQGNVMVGRYRLKDLDRLLGVSRSH